MTDDSQKERPVRLQHYFSYGIYRGFELLLKLFPMDVVCVIGGLIGTLASFILPSRKATVIRNLRIAYGDQLNLNQINNLCRLTYWRAGANILASIKANTMRPEDLHERIQVEGIENILTVSEKGSGVILLLAHMGNWEALVQFHLMSENLPPSGALYRPLGNPLLDKLVKRRREKTGTQLFSRSNGFFEPISHLKEGNMLGALVDQNAGSRGMAITMYGKLTSHTNLPALLHRRTGAPIIPISMSTISNGRWRINVYPPLEISGQGKTNTALATERCTQAFEKMLTESPSDVLWMHGYWKVAKKYPLKIRGTKKLKDSNFLTKPVKPFKLAIFVGNAPADAEEILTIIHELKNYREDIEITVISEQLTSPDAIHHIHLNPIDPPHIAANQILQYDRNMITPLDCIFDFTENASGEKIINLSGIRHAYAMQGKHLNKITALYFKKPEQRNLRGFIQSLGLPDQEDR